MGHDLLECPQCRRSIMESHNYWECRSCNLICDASTEFVWKDVNNSLIKAKSNETRASRIIETINKSIDIENYSVDRIGAYGILFENNLYGIIRVNQGKLALLGGGVDPNEALEIALCREVSEEIGRECFVTSLQVGVSVERLWSPKANKIIVSRQHYFYISLGETNGLKVEVDHELEWLTKPQALSQEWLYKSQRGALELKFGYFEL